MKVVFPLQPFASQGCSNMNVVVPLFCAPEISPRNGRRSIGDADLQLFGIAIEFFYTKCVGQGGKREK